MTNTSELLDFALALQSKGVRFLLVWNFKTEENTELAMAQYKRVVPKNQQKVICAFFSPLWDNYSILAVRGIPNFSDLQKLGFYAVKKDSANYWDPRYDQNKENTRQWHITDNLRWAGTTDLQQFFKKDSDATIIYE